MKLIHSRATFLLVGEVMGLAIGYLLFHSSTEFQKAIAERDWLLTEKLERRSKAGESIVPYQGPATPQHLELLIDKFVREAAATNTPACRETEYQEVLKAYYQDLLARRRPGLEALRKSESPRPHSAGP